MGTRKYSRYILQVSLLLLRCSHNQYNAITMVTVCIIHCSVVFHSGILDFAGAGISVRASDETCYWSRGIDAFVDNGGSVALGPEFRVRSGLRAWV